MIGLLIRIRFQSLFAGLTRQGKTKNGKKTGKGTVALFVVLYLYVAVVLCGMMAFLFHSLAAPYHAFGLDWLYFAMAGMISLAMAIFGTVFTTQNQLYAAKDNDLLLSMPIKPSHILLSRMISLLAMNLLFVGLIMGTAMVVYATEVGTLALGIGMQILSIAALTLLAQAIACLLGWLLHLIMGKLNKSIASFVFMVLFLVVYFGVYSQANAILSSMVANGQEIAGSLQNWVWPIYAMGMGCTGNVLLGLALPLISVLAFGLVYWLLSKTFLRTATASHSAKRKKVDYSSVKAAGAGQALVRKELRRFVGTPVYLTNMGLGLIFVVALAAAGVIFRGKVLEILAEITEVLDPTPYLSMVICAMLMFMSSMNCISTPSVSLEGKNLWVLKSMPVSGKQILLAKLRFHILMTCPITVAAGLLLGVIYGCGPVGTLMCAVLPGLSCLFCGLLGLICGLQWARLDWINEAYPCKQSVSVMVVLFTMMLLPVVLGGVYFGPLSMLSPNGFLGLCGALLALLCGLMYWAVSTWGVKKWDAL